MYVVTYHTPNQWWFGYIVLDIRTYMSDHIEQNLLNGLACTCSNFNIPCFWNMITRSRKYWCIYTMISTKYVTKYNCIAYNISLHFTYFWIYHCDWIIRTLKYKLIYFICVSAMFQQHFQSPWLNAMSCMWDSAPEYYWIQVMPKITRPEHIITCPV